MASAGSIFVDLLLNDSRYVGGLNRSRAATSSFARSAQSDANKTAQAFSGIVNPVSSVSTAIRSLAGIAAGALSVRGIIEYSDTWKQLEGRLSLVVSGMRSVSDVQNDLAAIAERTRQPLEGVYSLYTRISQAVPEAERAQYDLLGVTESINTALAITGEGSAQAASAILQFSQAVASDFQASSQEINSLLDSAPRIAQAIQRLFGDGSKSLKQLAKDGELSRDIILKGLAAMSEEGQNLRTEFAKIPSTVGQAFTGLNNEFLKFIGGNASANQATSALVSGINLLSKNLDTLATALGAVAIAITAKYATALAVGAVEMGRNALASSAAAVQAVNLAKANAAGALAAYNSARAQAALTGALGLVGPAAARATAASAALAAAQAANVGLLARFGGSLSALAGGPLGLFALGVWGGVTALKAMNGESQINIDTAEKYSRALAGTNNLLGRYASATDTARVAIKNETQEKIRSLEVELKLYEARAKIFNDMNVVQRAAGRTAGFLGFGPDVDQLEETARNSSELLGQLKQTFAEFETIKPFSVSGNAAASEAAKAIKTVDNTARDAARSMRDLAENARMQVETFEQSESAVIAWRIAQGDLSLTIAQGGAAAREAANQYLAYTIQKENLTKASEELNEKLRQEAEQAREVASLYEKYTPVIENIDDATYAYMQTMKELQILLDEYPEQSQKITEAMQRVTEEFESGGKSLTEYAREAARNMQDSLAEFLFDPFADGVDGMLKGFTNFLRQAAAEIAASELLKFLVGDFGSSKSSGGSIGGIVGDLFGMFSGGSPAPLPWLPSFDVGSYNVPNDMVAKIHKNEMIIPAQQANALRSGGGVGSTQIFNITTPDANSFRASERQIARAAKKGLAMS